MKNAEKVKGMKTFMKCLTLILVFMFALQPASIFVTRVYGETEENNFQIVHVNVRSTADTAEIYPGSNRVNLKSKLFITALLQRKRFLEDLTQLRE